MNRGSQRPPVPRVTAIQIGGPVSQRIATARDHHDEQCRGLLPPEPPETSRGRLDPARALTAAVPVVQQHELREQPAVVGTLGGTAGVIATDERTGRESVLTANTSVGSQTMSPLPRSGFTIEPGVYFDTFGVRTEINIVWTADGPEITGPRQQAIVPLV